MNKFFIAIFILAVGIVGRIPVAEALTLSIIPSSSPITIGAIVNTDLVISGLGSGGVPSTVGTFDVNIEFDASVLNLIGVTFGALLGDVSLGEAISSFEVSTTGKANLFEVSLLEASALTCAICVSPYLEDLQSTSFVLATLSFSGLSAGTSALTTLVNALGDGDGNDLALDLSTVAGRVTVTGVPEPGIFALLSIGLLGWICAKRNVQILGHL